MRGARDGLPIFPVARSPILGRDITSNSTGKPDVSSHAHRCCPERTLTRSGRPTFVSRLPPCHAPRLDTCRFSSTILPVSAYVWYEARYHHWWLGKISAHTTTAAHYVRRPLLGRPRTSPAQALFFSVRYGCWSGARLVVPSTSSR